jgi:hypothetical protein
MPTRQEVKSNCESEEEISAYIASVKKAPVKHFDCLAMSVNTAMTLRTGAGATPAYLLSQYAKF